MLKALRQAIRELHFLQNSSVQKKGRIGFLPPTKRANEKQRTVDESIIDL